MDFTNYEKKIVVDTPEGFVEAVKNGYHQEIKLNNIKNKDVFEYLEKNKNLDDDILCEYARCLQLGIGVEENVKEATKILKELAKKNHIEATFLLGAIYEDEGDDEKAGKYYEIAAKAGHPIAQCNLGCLCEFGDEYVEAYSWFKRAADSGSPTGLLSLGRAYEQGYNLEAFEEPDLKKAFVCYKKAADLGLREAKHEVGFCYYNGIGVQKDVKEAVRWLKMAAEENHAVAQSSLACVYEIEKETFPDIKREDIIYWYFKAAVNNEQNALKWIDEHTDEFNQWRETHLKK